MSAGGSVAGVVSGAGGKTLTFNVSERVMKGLNIGDPVTVEKERNGLQRRDLRDRQHGGRVHRTFQGESDLGDADGLASGTMVKVYVTAEKADNVMVVPADCVNYSNGDALRVYIWMPRHQRRKDSGGRRTPSILTRFRSFPDFLRRRGHHNKRWSKELYDGLPL